MKLHEKFNYASKLDCLSPTKLVLGATQTITIASILSDAIFFVPRFLLNIITKDIRVSEKKKITSFSIIAAPFPKVPLTLKNTGRPN